MRKIILFVALFAAFMIVKAQNPVVEVSVTDSTITTITASFRPNAVCDSYYYIIDSESSNPPMSFWLPMFPGYNIDSLVVLWGVNSVGNDDYTWTDLNPNETYSIYVVPVVNDSCYAMQTHIAHTAPYGGTGTALMSLSVTEITQTSALTTATPNDQVALFADAVITKEYFETVGQQYIIDSVLFHPNNSMYVLYTEDVWEWSLGPNTEYYFCAIGKNILGESGPFEKIEFATDSMGGIGDADVTVTITDIKADSAKISIVPNDQAAGYNCEVYEAEDFNTNIGVDSVYNFLTNISDQNMYYSTFNANITGLTAGKTYYVYTIARNAAKSWGELRRTEFSTITNISEYNVVDRIYPNPSNGIINIDLSACSDVSSVLLFNINGQIVFEQDVNNTSTVINAGNLAKGTYFMKFVSRSNRIIDTERIIIR